MKLQPLFPIRYVARQTGLSQHVIRVWERRYKVVVPGRTDTNRRLYSEADLKRLQLLKKAVERGHTISQVAPMDSEELMRLINLNSGPIPEVPGTEGQRPLDATYFCELSMASIVNLDAPGLEAALSQAAVHLSRPDLIQGLVLPLCKKMGDLWKQGELKIVHEHLATPVIRAFLWNMLRSNEVAELSPKLVIATPLGQRHELGALTIAIVACESGWQPLYFGPSLPAEEIAAAVTYSEAKAVALSVATLADHHGLKTELVKVRDYLSAGINIYVGGQNAAPFADLCGSVGIVFLKDLDSFRKALETWPD
jgi:MerR family transcriptional regulator, light-induced transcriptional regulator